MQGKTITTFAIFPTLSLFVLIPSFNNNIVNKQYFNDLEQRYYKGDSDPQNVLIAFVNVKGYDINSFELRVDESMEKIYVYPQKNIEIRLLASDVKISNGDVLRVWSAEQLLYYRF